MSFISLGHCIVHLFTIYNFRWPIWYRQTFPWYEFTRFWYNISHTNTINIDYYIVINISLFNPL
jgi:hypothetical protein